MKTGWRQYATRKDKLESIAFKSDGMSDEQKVIAWDRLMDYFKELSDPVAGRLPRFNDLLLGVVSAQSRAKARTLASSQERPRTYDEMTFP